MKRLTHKELMENLDKAVELKSKSQCYLCEKSEATTYCSTCGKPMCSGCESKTWGVCEVCYEKGESK